VSYGNNKFKKTTYSYISSEHPNLASMAIDYLAIPGFFADYMINE